MEEAMAPGFFLGDPGSTRQLLLVSPDLLPQVWPQVQPLFLQHSSIWSGYYTIESILLLLQAGRAQLWTMNDKDAFILALITEILSFPKLRVLNIMLIVGSELKDGLQFFDCVEMWARKQGATRSVGTGRRGFLRLLRPHGYKERAVTFEKDISGMMEH